MNTQGVVSASMLDATNKVVGGAIAAITIEAAVAGTSHPWFLKWAAAIRGSGLWHVGAHAARATTPRSSTSPADEPLQASAESDRDAFR